jgi:hypothetical protein
MKKSKGALLYGLPHVRDLGSLRGDNKGRARMMKAIEAKQEIPILRGNALRTDNHLVEVQRHIRYGLLKRGTDIHTNGWKVLMDDLAKCRSRFNEKD